MILNSISLAATLGEGKVWDYYYKYECHVDLENTK